MKKMVLSLIVFLFVVFLCSCNSISNDSSTSPTSSESQIVVQTFSIDDPNDFYQEYIKSFTQNLNIGKADEPQLVLKEAEGIWIQTYGDSDLESYKPYRIFYDNINSIWLVRLYTLPPNTVGGGPCVLIRKSDGQVLAMWQDK